MVTKEKERRKRKSEDRKEGEEKNKAMVALLVFIIATLAGKKLLDAKGLFGDNVIKNPATYIILIA